MKTILFPYEHPFHPEKGGINRVAYLLTKSLIKRGYNVIHICLGYPDQYKGYDYPTQINLFPSADLNSIENYRFYEKFLSEHNVDIIVNHAHWADNSLFMHLGTNTGIKRISVIHTKPSYNYDNLYKKRDSTAVESLKRILRVIKWEIKGYRKSYWNNRAKAITSIAEKSDIVCLLSDKFKNEFMRLAPNTEASKIVSIPNPNTYGKQIYLPQKKKQILFVGRLEIGDKHPDRMVSVWQRIYKKFPEWELIFVGDGPDRMSLEFAANKLDRVHFVGFQDPKPYYEQASILCLTSNFEGWGMVLTEAMLHGIVPMTFVFESAVEIIDNEKTGILVTPFSIKEYAMKLSKLMSDDLKRSQMANYAMKRVERYEIERVTDRWEELFNSLY